MEGIMTSARPRVVIVNASLGIREAFADGEIDAEIVASTNEAELRACLEARTDVVALGFEPSELSPSAALGIVAAARRRPSIILIDPQKRLKHLQRLAAKLHLDAPMHVPRLTDAAATMIEALKASRRISPDAADLRRALDEHDLMLYYQPKLDCANDRSIVGVEALVRWNHPELGVLLPSCILPLAATGGLLTELTDFTITEAIQQYVAWRNQGIDLPIAVNLAPALIRDAGCVERLLNGLHQFDVNPSRLTLELKETENVSDRDLCVDVLERLRRAGIGLALDDYGAGLSSITELYKLPFTEVKIDRDLIADAAHNRDARVVLRSIVHLAHALSIDVTGEGVETHADLTSAVAAGCDFVQGTLLCEPMPAFEVEQFLRSKAAGFRPKRLVGQTDSTQAAAH
jgi:EAL domain-containing protein (putative c-di-GMP-specific phosphodiesterase class I)